MTQESFQGPAVQAPGPSYDAVVVGSGATGSWAAKILAEAGWSVLLLEAGPEVRRERLDGRSWRSRLRRLWNLRLGRRQPIQSRHLGYFLHPPELFIDDRDFPYSTPKGRDFTWIRGRQVGGRSLTWAGVCLRMSDFELKAASYDGFGPDWPIGYEDLAAAYDQVEQRCGVHGSVEGLPQLPDGPFRPPEPQTPGELAFKTRIEARWPERRVIPARSIAKVGAPGGWPAVSSQAGPLADALATGRVTLKTGAAVSHLEIEPKENRASGVVYFDVEDDCWDVARASTVVLCASTLESTRILLNTRCRRFPDGLAAECDVLGRYLMDHHTCWLPARFPNPGQEPERLVWGGPHASLMPRFQNLGEPSEPYLRGFGLKLGIQRRPSSGNSQDAGVSGTLQAQGEMLPRPENRVTLDPNLKDVWGIPSLHIECSWSNNELRMAEAMAQTLRELVDEAGGEAEGGVNPTALPGAFVHEVGTARMGDDPESSVLDSQNRMWLLPNVLVTDGACWPSCGWQNPTLTMMAVTVRACELLARAGKA